MSSMDEGCIVSNFDEAAFKDGILVLAKRDLMENPSVDEQLSSSGSESNSSSDEASLDDTEESCYSSSQTENSAQESWSEGSTDQESEIDSSDNNDEDEDGEEANQSTEETLEGNAESDEEDGDNESDSGNNQSDIGDSQSDSDDRSESSDGSTRDEIILTHDDYIESNTDYLGGWSNHVYQYDSDSEASDRLQIRPSFPGQLKRNRISPGKNTASIAVYELQSGSLRRLFHYEMNIPIPLYHSPPVIHPSKPLVAWPLSGGDVLFADYAAKTYFIRRSMPTTRFSKSNDSTMWPWGGELLMRPHFSTSRLYEDALL
jgi:hypothetical protein